MIPTKVGGSKKYIDTTTNDVASDSCSSPSFIQQISSHIGVIRGKHLLGAIEKMLNEHKRVLVLYGGSHLLTLTSALTDLMGIPRYQRLVD